MGPPPLPREAVLGFSSFLMGSVPIPVKAHSTSQDIVIAMMTGIGTGRGGIWIVALGAGIATMTAAGITTEVGIPKAFQGQREWERDLPHGQPLTGNPPNSQTSVTVTLGCVIPSHSQTAPFPSQATIPE